MPSISQIHHPYYKRRCKDWYSYRLAYEGGEKFCYKYLLKHSERETHKDFQRRVCVTPIPAFAKAAVKEIRNAIFQRLSSVSRKGGSAKYQAATSGQLGGVDNDGNSMTTFLGTEVLDELLVVEQVGILVEAPAVDALIPPKDFKPYLCMFSPEDIRTITYGKGPRRREIDQLVIRESHIEYDSIYGLPHSECDVYRRFWIGEDGYVWHEYINAGEFNPLTRKHAPDIRQEATRLNLKRIPFVLMDIKDSLMADVVRHQVALLNLNSTAVTYSINSNFSLYVEQGDALGGHLYTKGAGVNGNGNNANDSEIKVGPLRGRRYQKGTDAPGFINPSSEPIDAALKMMDNLKKEIRQLVHLAVSNLGTRTSGDSKEKDQTGLEAGLSFIGLILEAGEREIARHWAAYENIIVEDQEIATICYPSRWNLKSTKDQIEEAKAAYEMSMKLPGNKIKREASKKLAEVLLQGQVSEDIIIKIHDEIDSAPYVSSDISFVESAMEQGLLGNETGAMALGFNADEAAKAMSDKAEKLRQIQAAQTSAPLVGNGDPVQGIDQTPVQAREQKREERDAARGVAGRQPTRGEGRRTNEE